MLQTRLIISSREEYPLIEIKSQDAIFVAFLVMDVHEGCAVFLRYFSLHECD